MNNTSTKWSVAANYLYLSVELMQDGRFMTGSDNVRHPVNNQSDEKLKPSRDLVARVSRASNCLLVITPGTYWLK